MNRRRALAISVVIASCGGGERVPLAVPALEGYAPLATLEVADGTIADAYRLPSGQYLVRGVPNVLGIYDSAGALTHRIGRVGSGPGEFRQLAWAAPGGADSIWTYDVALKRLSLFSGDGTFKESWRPEGLSLPSVQARLSDGTLILVDPMMPMPARTGGLRTHSIALYAWRLPDTHPQRLVERPWWTLYQANEGVALIGQPFGPTGMVAASDSTFWYGFGDSAAVEELNGSGAVVGRIQLSVQAQRLSSADEAWARAQGEHPSDLSGVRELFASVPLPPTQPMISGLLAHDARVWTRLARVSDTVAGLWLSLNAKNDAVDTLRLPPGVELLSISGAIIVTKWSAPGGEEFVRSFRRIP